MKATKLQLAYFAGFFDGEGSISAQVPNREYAIPTVIVSLTQKTAPILQEILRSFPEGRLSYYTSDSWQLNYNGRKALPFLRAVLPYLRRLNARALLAVELLDRPDARKTGGITPEERAARLGLAESIRALNHPLPTSL